MRDLTQGSITKHIIAMAIPISIGMLVQTLYFFVDLYFVAGLGDAALAGVSSAGILQFAVMALTQTLSVGAVSLISHAVGRKDQADANHIFNQLLLLSGLCALVTLIGGYGLAKSYMHLLAADTATINAGISFIQYLLPGLALQFVMTGAGSGLRGTGIVKPTMLVQLLTVLLNLILAPVLIAGWGTGYAMGVAGAGLATSIACLGGTLASLYYFKKLETYVKLDRQQLAFDASICKRILGVGLPAGGEFFFIFIFMAVLYGIIRDFGASAQAGFGLGTRLMQAIFLPVMAISFAIAPIAGQNFGAKLSARVRETVRSATILVCTLMAVLTLLCQISPGWLVHFFTQDPEVSSVASEYLRIISWNFVASGFIFACSGTFQALGNTWPSFISMGSRVITFALPALWLSHQSGFKIIHVWYLSVATVTLQALISLFLLRHEMNKQLKKITGSC